MMTQRSSDFYRSSLPVFFLAAFFFCVFFILSPGGYAEVTLDGSLGPQKALTGPDYQIRAEDGTVINQTNLFHSFGTFNIGTNESATFSGPDSISNILGRVTGGAQSWIDGLIRSTIPDANLFLLNPSGVLFGPNASLDVQGSFHVSTADYLRLGEAGVFYADPTRNSILTVDPPSAFGFLGDNPGVISVQGSNLQVPEGKTLSLIGGDIDIVEGES
jgi:filamentous hemagglutinin family protein